MCITQQQQQTVFGEIERALEKLNRNELEQNNGFAKILIEFRTIFREINHANDLPYDEKAGKQNRCVFFSPFRKRGSPWQGSVEILESTSHYTLFDRYGRFSMYNKAEKKFGDCIVTNSKDHAIAKLKGVPATDILSEVRRLRLNVRYLEEKIAEDEFNIRVLHDRIEMLNRRNGDKP